MNNDIRPVDFLVLKFDRDNNWVELPLVEVISGSVDADALADERIVLTSGDDKKQFTKAKFRDVLIKEFKPAGGVVTDFVIQPAGIPETLEVVTFKNKYSK